MSTFRLSPTQICGSNFSYLRWPLERWLDDMVDIGFTSVELWGVSPHLYVEDLNLSDVRKVRDAIASRDLTLKCLTPEQLMYPINIAAREDVVRRRSIEYFHKSLSACEALECDTLFIIPGWGYADEPAADVWGRSAESLGLIAQRAKELGIKLVLEALQPFESHVLLRAEQIAQMLKDVDSDSLHVAIDVVAMAVAGETVADYTKLFGDRIGYSHFIDGSPSGHLAWGDGTLPMRKYLQEFKEAEYSGGLGFEIINSNYWLDPRTAQERSRTLVVEAMHELNGSV